MSESSDEIKYQKLLIFGKRGSGKTSLVKKMKKGIIEGESIPGFEDPNQVGNQIKVKEESLYLNTLEYRILQGGFEGEESFLKTCLFACKCAVFMIDATSADSLSLVKNFLEKINTEEFPKLSFIFVLNKIDARKTIDFEQVKALSVKINQEKPSSDMIERAFALEVSLKNGTNYRNLIKTISKYVSKKVDFSIDSISDLVSTPKHSRIIYIMLVGDLRVGKSYFLHRYIRGFSTRYDMSPIIYDDYVKIIKINDEIIKVRIWNFSGRVKGKGFFKSFFKNSNGFIVFYDVTSEESFGGVKDWFVEIEENNRGNPIIYIVGNKADIPKREVSREDAEGLAKFYGAKYFETSAMINLNVNEIMLNLLLECSKCCANNNEGFHISERKGKKNSC